MTSSYLYRSRPACDLTLTLQNHYGDCPGGHAAERELVVSGLKAGSAESFRTTCDDNSDFLLVSGYENDAL